MTTEQVADLYFKQATISNILMLQDYLPQYQYGYETLIKLTLVDLEYMRDSLIKEYNEVIAERTIIEERNKTK